MVRVNALVHWITGGSAVNGIVDHPWRYLVQHNAVQSMLVFYYTQIKIFNHGHKLMVVAIALLLMDSFLLYIITITASVTAIKHTIPTHNPIIDM